MYDDKEEGNDFSPLRMACMVMMVIFAVNEKTGLLLHCFALSLMATVIHLMGFVVAGTLAGVQIDQIQIFAGSNAAAIKLRRLTLSIGSLPIGGFVKLQGMDYEEDCNEGFCCLPKLWRITIIGSGAFALLATACLLVGPSKALSGFVLGFVQIIHGALSPLTYGQVLLERLSRVCAERGLIYTFGILTTKIAAANLLPLPTLNGGQMVFELLGIRASKNVYRWQLVGLTLSGILFVGLLMAIVVYILKHL